LHDFALAVAKTRIRRPIVPFNCAIALLIPRLCKFAAELVLHEWIDSPILGDVVMDGVCVDVEHVQN
jgi:hypothetical protein